MKINIYPVVSPLHEKEQINIETVTLLEDLRKIGNFEINITSIDELYESDLSLILVQSGGSEKEFQKILRKLEEPIY